MAAFAQLSMMTWHVRPRRRDPADSSSRSTRCGPEYDAKVVGRHRRYVLQRKAVRGCRLAHGLQVANAPIPVAGSELPVERLIARGRVPSLTPVWAIEDQHPGWGEETRGTGHQRCRGGPGGDMDHVDAHHRVRRLDRPGLPADIQVEWGLNVWHARLCDPRSDGGAQLRVGIARLPSQMQHCF